METITIDRQLEKELNRIESFIGHTPLFLLGNLSPKKNVKIYAKLEWNQLSNSVKARAAFSIIKQAVLNGDITKEKGLIDASSGNTGVAYAAIGAAIGIPVTICIPENASSQKKAALSALGANIIYTSRFGTTDEAQVKAKTLSAENPNKYFYTDQYANPNNWKAHYNGTALEILKQTEGRLTHFVTGLGTTGTFIGTSRRLKEENPLIRTISLQPDAAMHGLEGWKHMESAIVPKIYDTKVADENLFIDTVEAFDLIKKVAKNEGLILSPSSAANLLGAIKVAENLNEGMIVTTFPDHGSNYPEVMEHIFG